MKVESQTLISLTLKNLVADPHFPHRIIRVLKSLIERSTDDLEKGDHSQRSLTYQIRYISSAVLKLTRSGKNKNKKQLIRDIY